MDKYLEGNSNGGELAEEEEEGEEGGGELIVGGARSVGWLGLIHRFGFWDTLVIGLGYSGDNEQNSRNTILDVLYCVHIIYIYALLPQYQDIGDPGWQCGLKERGSSVYL